MPNESFSSQGEPTTQEDSTTTLDKSTVGINQTPIPTMHDSRRTLTDREIIQATTPQDLQAPQPLNNDTKQQLSQESKYQFQHDIDGLTAANNHTKPEQDTEPQKYQFEHDIRGHTAATNHLKTEQNPEPQPEQKSAPQPFLEHDIKHVTAATNHIKQEQSTQNNPQQTDEIERSRRESDKQMMTGENPKERAYVHKVLDNNQRRFASLDDAEKEDNTRMYVRERHIDKAREEMESDFAKRETKQEESISNKGSENEVETEPIVQPELTPKQKLAETEKRFAQLTTLRRKNLLTEEEKTEYLNLLNERELLEEQLQNKKVETEKSGGEEMEKRKKERDYKRIALIAGVAAGGATGIIGGLPAASVGFIATAVARLGTYATDKLSARNINYLQNELKNAADTERKALLEKRLSKWQKVVNVTQHINSFLKGAGIGLAGSSLISGLLMGGKGIAEALASRREAAALETANAGTPSADVGQPAGGVTAEAPTAEPTTSGSIETPPKTSGSIEMTNIPDTLPFDQYPLLREGLLEGGMDPAYAKGALQIAAEGTTPGGWMARQREVVEMINRLGFKIDSIPAGKTIAKIVGNNLPVTAEKVSEVFSEAAASLGN